MTDAHDDGDPPGPTSRDPAPPHAEAPSIGEEGDASASSGPEPTTTGTVFVMLLFLMALAGMWALMYVVLLGR